VYDSDRSVVVQNIQVVPMVPKEFAGNVGVHKAVVSPIRLLLRKRQNVRKHVRNVYYRLELIIIPARPLSSAAASRDYAECVRYVTQILFHSTFRPPAMATVAVSLSHVFH
jgi:hypothetical protein